MAKEQKKISIYEDDKVHIDFVGKEAAFIRRVAYLTERSNNDVGKLLIGLLMRAHQKVAIQLKPDAEITGKNKDDKMKFSNEAEIIVQIDLGDL